MPYVLHAFLQISSLCREVYIGVSQAETKLPFPRTCYTKCASKPEGYHFNPPNHSADIILQSAVFLHTKQHGKLQKCTEKRKAKVTKLRTSWCRITGVRLLYNYQLTTK